MGNKDKASVLAAIYRHWLFKPMVKQWRVLMDYPHPPPYREPFCRVARRATLWTSRAAEDLGIERYLVIAAVSRTAAHLNRRAPPGRFVIRAIPR